MAACRSKPLSTTQKRKEEWQVTHSNTRKTINYVVLRTEGRVRVLLWLVANVGNDLFSSLHHCWGDREIYSDTWHGSVSYGTMITVAEFRRNLLPKEDKMKKNNRFNLEFLSFLSTILKEDMLRKQNTAAQNLKIDQSIKNTVFAQTATCGHQSAGIKPSGRLNDGLKHTDGRQVNSAAEDVGTRGGGGGKRFWRAQPAVCILFFPIRPHYACRHIPLQAPSNKNNLVRN